MMLKASDQHRKRCFLGMPGYGDMSPGAARAFYRATSGTFSVRREYQEGSLLACNMNKLWCAALNDSRKHGLNYFAMQHSDVQAEDFWLDAAVAELEDRGLDVLGVAVPIKDSRGLSSVALARPDGDNWRPHGRLTMTELYRLPETFTSEDVGYPILNNTGLWICKFGFDWARLVHFTVNDRNVLNEVTGDYEAQTEPEDWFISRLFHELKLKIGCTRKIAVAHRGCFNFCNTKPWGDWDYDQEALTESVVPVKGWFPRDVAGWLTEDEGKELSELARDKAVLEIGSFCGLSTICLAQCAKAVYAVDTFDGRGTAIPGDTLALFKRNIDRYGVTDRVYPVKGKSEDVVPNMPPIFDVAFIDGSHDVESVQVDTGLALSVLRPGGLIVFHDYQKQEDPGVTEAVDELIAGGADLLRRVDSLAVIRPTPAEISVEG